MIEVDPGKFIVFRRLTVWGHRWFFHGLAANREIVAQSQPYRSKAAAYKGIGALKRICAFGEVRDESDA